MTAWENLTNAQKDELNQAAYAACADLLRRAQAAYPGCDLVEYKRFVGEQLAADYAENARVIRRAQRTRSTRMDRSAALAASAWNDRLALQMGILQDVEI